LYWGAVRLWFRDPVSQRPRDPVGTEALCPLCPCSTVSPVIPYHSGPVGTVAQYPRWPGGPRGTVPPVVSVIQYPQWPSRYGGTVALPGPELRESRESVSIQPCPVWGLLGLGIRVGSGLRCCGDQSVPAGAQAGPP